MEDSPKGDVFQKSQGSSIEEIMNFDHIDTTIVTIGEAKIPSPIRRGEKEVLDGSFVADSDKVLIDVRLNNLLNMIQEKKDFPCF